MGISFEFSEIILNWKIFSLLLVFLFCLIFSIRAVAFITLIFLAVTLFGGVIKKPLLMLADAKYLWYVVWSCLGSLTAGFLYFACRKNKELYRIALSLGVALMLQTLVILARFLERHTFDTGYTKTLYTVGMNVVSFVVILLLLDEAIRQVRLRRFK